MTLSYADEFSNFLALIKTSAQKTVTLIILSMILLKNLAPIERVIELDKSPPEFTGSFINYVNLRVTGFVQTSFEYCFFL